MRTITFRLFLTVFALSLLQGPAWADDGDGKFKPKEKSFWGRDTERVTTREVQIDGGTGSDANDGPSNASIPMVPTLPTCDGGSHWCIPRPICTPDSDSPTGYTLQLRGRQNTGAVLGPCSPGARTPATGSAPRVVTMTMVLRAFREVALPESRIVVQPPGGTTLVNFETLFRTEADPFTRSVRLLG